MRLRRVEALPRGGFMVGLVGTTLVHGALGVGLIAGLLFERSALRATIYSVELVAAPAPTRPRARTTTRPAPPPLPTVNPTPAPNATAPVPKPKAPPKTDPKVEPAREAAPREVPNPGVTPSTGDAVENVRVEGEVFPFPDYLKRIVNEVMRRWARPVGLPLSAEVAFTIMRDGTVREIKVTRSSRNYTFDLEAQGAVEAAGSDKAFGPLPPGWPSEMLQIAFLFTPRNP